MVAVDGMRREGKKGRKARIGNTRVENGGPDEKGGMDGGNIKKMRRQVQREKRKKRE